MANFFRIIKEHPVLSIMILIIVTVIFTYTAFATHTYFVAFHNNVPVPETYIKYNLFQISDGTWTDEEYEQLYGDAKNFIPMNNFISHLKDNENFFFQVSNLHPIGLADQNSNIFNYMHEYGERPEDFVFEGTRYHLIKGAQFNDVAFKLNDIRLYRGRMFTEKEYYYSEKRIPLILGYDYNEIYNVGDVLEIHYLFKNYEAEVIGFTEKDQTALTTYEPFVNLNRYIILPPLFYSNDNINNLSKLKDKSIPAQLSLHISGFLISKLSEDKILSIVDEIADSNRHMGFYISNMTEYIDAYLYFKKGIKDYIISFFILITLLTTYFILTLKLLKIDYDNTYISNMPKDNRIESYHGFLLFIGMFFSISIYLTVYIQYGIDYRIALTIVAILSIVLFTMLVPIILQSLYKRT